MTERYVPPRRKSPIWVLLLLVVLAVTMAGIFPVRQIIAQERAVDLTQRKLDALNAENARLEALAAELVTPAAIERMARERFGLVREGEVGVIVEWGTPAPPQPVPSLVHDDRRWFERVWDFVTGRDGAP